MIKDGFKETKIGRIPEEWEVMYFKDIFQFISTSSHSKAQMTYDETENKIFNIHYGAIHTTYKEPILDFNKYNIPKITDDSNMPNEHQYLKSGDLVIVDASEDAIGLGECVELKNTNEEKVIGGLHTYAVRDKIGKTVQGFRGYILKNNNVKKILMSYANRSKVYGITKKSLGEVIVILPTLSEQQKIAEILSTVDEAIEKTATIIEETRQLKKGLMQSFFLNKAYMIKSRAEEENTNLKAVRLSDLGKIVTGTTPSTHVEEYYDSNDYMFIGPADLGNNKRIISSIKYISNDGFEVSRKLPKDSVMVVCIGATIGKIGITNEPSSTNQQVNTIIPSVNYSNNYIYYLLSGISEYLRAFAGDTATPQLNKTDFGKVITFVHTDFDEREKIVRILSEVDTKIEKEEATKADLEQLKKGLMQVLLTGKVRVKA